MDSHLLLDFIVGGDTCLVPAVLQSVQVGLLLRTVVPDKPFSSPMEPVKCSEVSSSHAVLLKAVRLSCHSFGVLLSVALESQALQHM